jgi:hypothetical protein
MPGITSCLGDGGVVVGQPGCRKVSKLLLLLLLLQEHVLLLRLSSIVQHCNQLSEVASFRRHPTKAGAAKAARAGDMRRGLKTSHR